MRAIVPLLLTAIGLTGCMAPARPTPRAPALDYAGTKGSASGNYPGYGTGETWRAEDGALCSVFHWDRPVGDGTAIRLRSASCPVPGRPGLFALRDLGRTVVPLASSTLAGWTGPAPLPDDPVSPSAPVVPVTVEALPR